MCGHVCEGKYCPIAVHFLGIGLVFEHQLFECVLSADQAFVVCGTEGVLQTSPGRLQSWGCLRLRVTLLCQVQVLQEDQDVGHALELCSVCSQRGPLTCGPRGIHVCHQTRGKTTRNSWWKQNDRWDCRQGKRQMFFFTKELVHVN